MATAFADGNTSLGVYEFGTRYIEIDGIPYGGWKEGTGGGVARDGQTHVIGAGGVIRGMTNGIAKPQEFTMKWEPMSWENIKDALRIKALSNGITDPYGYQQVDFSLIDQWRGASLLQPSITTTSTVRVRSEKPNTASDGTDFDVEVVMIPVALPTVTKGL